MRSRRPQSLFRDRSIILRFLIIALVVSVLLLSAKARLFQTSAIAQIPTQSTPSNPCSALVQRDFAAIPDTPTAILSAQVVPAAAQTPEYCEVKGYVTPQIQFEVRLPTPNLAAFRDRGGKLILYHGWADPAIPPHGTLAYYQAVQDTMGGLANVQQFALLFMLPGVYHCQGGTGPSRVDWLTPIVAWVEQGTPPTKIIASQTANDAASGGFSNPTERSTSSNTTLVRTRPIFPYPMQARYSGRGSIDDAANFVGVMPSQTLNDQIDWIGNDLFEPQ